MRRIGMAVAVLFSLIVSARAVTLDWNGQTWTPGWLSNSYHVDPGTVGNDLTVTISGDTGQLQTSLAAPNPQTPAITQAFQGGMAQPVSALELGVTFANNTQKITVTIDFAAHYALGVNNVSFTLFDIDKLVGGGTNFQDQITSIYATSTDGVTKIAPIISGVGSATTLAGAGIFQTLTGNGLSSDLGAGSGDGNATISFGGQAIQSLTFTYGSDPGVTGSPTYEHIGVYNLDFTPVPEINPTMAVSLVSGLAGFVAWRRRRRGRSE
jgi:hypothetical protein